MGERWDLSIGISMSTRLPSEIHHLGCPRICRNDKTAPKSIKQKKNPKKA